MAANDDYEHWPDDTKLYTKPAAAPPPTDGWQQIGAGVQAPRSAPPMPTNFIQQPQPVYYAHPPSAMTYPAPQYYSHPPQPQSYYPAQYPQHHYYTYAPQEPAPPPPPAPAPAPPPPAAPAPVMSAPPANYHVYQPAGFQPQAVPGAPHANVWLGRTKEQVDEDNMKIAKQEGVYDKRKFAPIADDDQYFWVIELDGKPTLRDYRFIKSIKGDWKEDPRYAGAYYFVREEDKK